MEREGREGQRLRAGPQRASRTLDTEAYDPSVDLGADAVRNDVLKEVDACLHFAGLLAVDVDAASRTRGRVSHCGSRELRGSQAYM